MLIPRHLAKREGLLNWIIFAILSLEMIDKLIRILAKVWNERENKRENNKAHAAHGGAIKIPPHTVVEIFSLI